MTRKTTRQALLAGAAALCFAAPAHADPYLLASAGDTTATEGVAPFVLSDDLTQTLITDRATLNAKGLPGTFGNWDMSTFGPFSRFIFIPAEVSNAAGVFRYDTVTGDFVTLMEGVGGGGSAREDDAKFFKAEDDEFVRIDPATLTPWGSIITGEETTGGRLFEIVNAMARPNGKEGKFNVRWRNNVPAVAHEGLRFDTNGVLYFVDEDRSGSIYKFAPKTPGDLGTGQTFVLSADAYAAEGDAEPSQNWDSTANRPLDAARFGAATWVPITDEDGLALTAADPFEYVFATGGRAAADEVKGTPYGRPEDIGMGVLANGHEVAYVSITSENRVLSIELIDDEHAYVREFVNFDTTNLATGTDVNTDQNDPYADPVATPNFQSPDNIAVGADGTVYVIEDNNPGDIWITVDADRDGVAEGMGIWASLGVAGSEPTGLIVDPNDPKRFIVNIQHPSSGNDALWEIRVD